MEQDKYVNESSLCSFGNEASESANTASSEVSEKVAQVLKRLKEKKTMKFMDNFDPEKSDREQRKLMKKINRGSKGNLYNENGILLAQGKDLCDCLEEECEGCFFPCVKCRSCKCGHECRQNRKWMYEQFEVAGTDEVVKNKYC